jgi:hypothetical protein
VRKNVLGHRRRQNRADELQLSRAVWSVFSKYQQQRAQHWAAFGASGGWFEIDSMLS